jgi:outer membrane receptor protein involved in Fe transport
MSHTLIPASRFPLQEQSRRRLWVQWGIASPRFFRYSSLAFPVVAQQPSAPQPPAQPAPVAQHETVVVTGTFEPLSLEEMDRAITLLPARANDLVLNALVDLLRTDPALDLQETGAQRRADRPLDTRRHFAQTLVLLDGQRLSDAQTGHHDMDIPVPLDTIQQVEVLRGSGSTLYGSDAIGGVINIITAPPEDMELRLRTSVGNDGINQQRASISETFGPVSEQLSFARDFSTGFMPDRDYRNLNFASVTHLVTAWGPSDLTAWPTWTTRSAPTTSTDRTPPGKTPRPGGLAGGRHAGQEDRSELRLAPAQRSVRAVPRSARNLHQSSRR